MVCIGTILRRSVFHRFGEMQFAIETLDDRGPAACDASLASRRHRHRVVGVSI